MKLRIVVDIPALDRLVTFLESREQVQIDALAQRVGQLTAVLTKSNTALLGIIQKENTPNAS